MFDSTAKAKRHSEARDFVRMMIARAAGGGATEYFKQRWPESRNIDVIQRAAVEPGKINGESWGDELSPERYLASAFVEITLAKSVFGRITGMRQVPFNIRFPVQTGAASFGWVPSGGIVPCSSMSFTTASFKPLKVGGIVVTTQELAKLAAPDAETIISADLAAGIGSFLDEAFLDPNNAGVAGESPASVTYGAPHIDATGVTAVAAKDDLRRMLGNITTDMVAPYIVMRRTTALHLAASDGGLDADNGAFRFLGPNGGTIWGIPVLTTASVPQGAESPPHNRIIAFDAAELLVGDVGLEVDITEQADLLMDSEPDSPPTGSSVLVNLWQHNLTAFKATRFVNWQWRKSGAVSYIDKVEY